MKSCAPCRAIRTPFSASARGAKRGQLVRFFSLFLLRSHPNLLSPLLPLPCARRVRIVCSLAMTCKGQAGDARMFGLETLERSFVLPEMRDRVGTLTRTELGVLTDKQAHTLAQALFLDPPMREKLLSLQRDARIRPTVARIALQLRYEQNKNVVSRGKARKAYMLSVRDMPGGFPSFSLLSPCGRGLPSTDPSYCPPLPTCFFFRDDRSPTVCCQYSFVRVLLLLPTLLSLQVCRTKECRGWTSWMPARGATGALLPSRTGSNAPGPGARANRRRRREGGSSSRTRTTRAPRRHEATCALSCDRWRRRRNRNARSTGTQRQLLASDRGTNSSSSSSSSDRTAATAFLLPSRAAFWGVCRSCCRRERDAHLYLYLIKTPGTQESRHCCTVYILRRCIPLSFSVK